jgi:hypothetical protein
MSSGSLVRAVFDVTVENQGNVAKENLTRIVLPRYGHPEQLKGTLWTARFFLELSIFRGGSFIMATDRLSVNRMHSSNVNIPMGSKP